MPVPQKRLTVEKLTQAPRAFAAAFARINRALRVLEAIANMEGKGGVVITKAEANWVVEVQKQEGGVPAGYAEESFTICDSGSPTDVFMLVRRP